MRTTFEASDETNNQRNGQAASREQGGNEIEPGQPSLARQPAIKDEDRPHQQDGDKDRKQGAWHTKFRIHPDSSFRTTITCAVLSLALMNVPFAITFVCAYLLAYGIFSIMVPLLRVRPHADDPLTQNRLPLAFAGIVLASPIPGPFINYALIPVELNVGGLIMAILTAVSCAAADQTGERAA